MGGVVTFLIALAVWAATGCLVGWLFGMIMGTGKGGGFWGYVLLGMIGALLSGLLFRVLGGAAMLTNWLVNITAGVVGALILVVMAEYGAHQREHRPENKDSMPH